MKKLIILSSIVISALSLNSCTDNFLTVQSASKLLADGTYYNTKAHLTEALVAAYDPLKWFDYSFGQYESLPFVSDVMSDDVMTGGSDQNDCLYLHKMSNYSALPTSVCSNSWTICYSGVNRSNIVLQFINNAADMTDAEKAEYKAEATVLRSFFYKVLWKYWGNIPYYEKNLTSPYLCQQSNHDQVYGKIAAALETIIDQKVLPVKSASGSEGHVTQAMAEMLYAEVVMYQNDNTRYSKALGYMKDIIGSTKYSLVNDYASMWESTGEWGTESIFEINYTAKNGAHDWGSAIATGGSVYPKLIGINSLNGSPDYVGGWGFEPVCKSAYTMFDATDKRRDASILNFATYATVTGASYAPRYEDTGYFMRKYLPRVGGNAGYTASADMNYNNNIRVYRYAETLLNAAELTLATNGGADAGGQAQGYLNTVRSRAGLATIPVSIDNIMNERHLEFVGEGKRYWDLIRSGKASTVLVPGSALNRTVGWSVSKKYLPLPQSDVDSGQGTLTQNNY
jgi:hypothetical protein